MKLFEDATGIHVNYEDVIQSNEEFYGKIQPQLAGGDSTGWDIIVITNGRQFNVLTGNEVILRLDTTKRPNFDANATPFAKDPTYDPGNTFSMPWQGEFTGIGYDQDEGERHDHEARRSGESGDRRDEPSVGCWRRTCRTS